jgi:hypothetical protein
MTAIKLRFGSPKHGWLPVELFVGEKSRVFDASDVPADSLKILADVVSRWYDGVAESSVTWFLEPDEEEWIIARRGESAQLTVKYRSASQTRTLEDHVLDVLGPPSDICIPIWRALRALESDPAWAVSSPDRVWSSPFPTNSLAELTRRIKASERS